MKKFSGFAICVFLALLIGGGMWQQHRAARKSYLKNETWMKHLNLSVFLDKSRCPLPQWMEEQIQDDFAAFEGRTLSNVQVDATFQKILSRMNPKSFIVRYRILDNELYRLFLDDEPISLQDNSTEKALKTLLACMSFKDMDFLFSYFDGVPWCDKAEEIYCTNAADLQAPLFFSAKRQGTPFVVLIPDWRSIGHWWISDIKHVKSRMPNFPWEKKKAFALWRGSLTKQQRLEFCRIAARNPSHLDAKLNVPVNDPLLQAQIEEEGLFGDRASWEEFLECKYLPMVDGVMCAAPALQWRLLSNSVLFKPDSDEIQWFYRALIPYVHYVPVKSDLSDLIDQLDWAKNNDAFCKGIAECSTQFALDYLMYEDVLLYFSSVLKRYASLQKIDRSELKREIKEDPRWVKIQSRTNIKAMAEKRQMAGFTREATPF